MDTEFAPECRGESDGVLRFAAWRQSVRTEPEPHMIEELAAGATPNLTRRPIRVRSLDLRRPAVDIQLDAVNEARVIGSKE